MICPVEFTHELSALKERRGKLRGGNPQQYSAAETERMMKLHDVLLKAMAKKIRWWDAAKIIGQRSAIPHSSVHPGRIEGTDPPRAAGPRGRLRLRSGAG